MPHRAFATLLALVLLIAAGPAAAQRATVCAAREEVIARLADRFGETRRSIGLGANNSVVEVFASEATGTWTIIVTLPDGRSCLVAAGDAFEEIAEAEAQGTDA